MAIVNKVQLPVKCSKCGNKMFRTQYTQFGDKHIHTQDYCAECDKELEYRMKGELDSERKVSLRNKHLLTVFLVLAIIAVVLWLLRFFKKI